MNPPVGRVLGTLDATPLEFWVGVDELQYLQLDDVVVGSNLFGDIFSDLGPAVAGGRVVVMDYVLRSGEVKNNPSRRDEIEGNERVLCFDAQTYIDILRDCTEACFAVMAQMSRRLHGHIAEIDRLTLHSATFRVVCYLLDQVPSTHLGVPEVRLDTPKHVIAAPLSVTPETLSRSFSKLSREGLIEVHDNAITLTDVDKLRRFAQGESL